MGDFGWWIRQETDIDSTATQSGAVEDKICGLGWCEDVVRRQESQKGICVTSLSCAYFRFLESKAGCDCAGCMKNIL